ncbi:MAG: FAD-dependent oxidoreductase [Thermofilum sp.]
MPEHLDVAVIGGGPAGMTAASRAKRLKPSLRVAVFERSSYVSYAPCGIPYYLGGLAASIDDLVHYPLRVFTEERGIEVYVRTEVTEVGDGYLKARRHTGETLTFEWSKLLIATGAKPRRLNVPGSHLPGTFYLRTLEDAEAARSALSRARRVAVVGAGYIGVELAENLAKIGKEVILIEVMQHVMPQLDPEISETVEGELRRGGVEVHTGEKVLELSGSSSVNRVITDKGEYPVDAVFVAIGVAPEVELAKQLGLKLGQTGAVEVDKRMQTSLEDVYAAGDVAQALNLVTGKPDWFPLAPIANKMGYVAGANIAGVPEEFPGAVGTAVTKVFDLEVGRTGLTEEQAKREGYNPVSALITARTKPSYYPGASEIKVKLVVDSETGRLLGAQAVGREGVLARINAAATLLSAGATYKDVFFSDLGYAPPFAPVWDPLVVAARVLAGKLRGTA